MKVFHYIKNLVKWFFHFCVGQKTESKPTGAEIELDVNIQICGGGENCDCKSNSLPGDDGSEKG